VNKKRDPLEEILANTIKQQDDIVKYSIRQGEKIDFVMEKSHQLQFIRDPVTGGYMPITVCNLIYDVDENGKPLGRVTSTGFCRFGCKVRVESLAECRVCHSSACSKHSFRVGENAFCKKGKCRILGRLWQIVRCGFLVVRFCLRTITGLNAES
jgi:hypothetical protein